MSTLKEGFLQWKSKEGNWLEVWAKLVGYDIVVYEDISVGISSMV